MCGCRHTGVFVSMPLCMDASVCACQRVSKKGILLLREMWIQNNRHRHRNRGREAARVSGKRERKKIISCYVIPAKPDKPPPRLIWLSIQCG